MAQRWTVSGWLVATALAACALAGPTPWARAADATAPAPSAASQPSGPIRIQVGRDTTRLTEPLAADGLVDYVAALDQALNRDLAPEANAAIPLLQTLGVDGPPPVRERTIQRMKLSAAHDGRRFPHLREFVADQARAGGAVVDDKALAQRQEQAEEHLRQARAGPWQDAQFPLVAAWLDGHKALLEGVAAGAQRSRFCVPPESGLDPQVMAQISLAYLNTFRSVGYALAARVGRQLQAGDVAAAWRDALTLYRLGRLVKQQRLMLAHLVGIGLEKLGNDAVVLIAQYGELDRAQVLRMVADLQGLPVSLSAGPTLDFGERYLVLDLVQGVQRDGTWAGVSDMFTRMGAPEPVDKAEAAKVPLVIDYNAVLWAVNGAFDRAVPVFGQSNFSAGMNELALIDRDWRKRAGTMADRFGDPGFRQGYLEADDAGKRALMTPVVCAIAVRLEARLFGRAFQTDQTLRMQTDLAEAALGLAGYYADQGEFPPVLEHLAPRYIPSVPRDVFVNRPLIYQRPDKGVLVYSVGSNLGDDKGNPDQTRDVVLRLGPPRRPR